MNKRISKRTLSRLPIYLSLLQEKEREGVEYISATTIANLLDLNHVQVDEKKILRRTGEPLLRNSAK